MFVGLQLLRPHADSIAFAAAERHAHGNDKHAMCASVSGELTHFTSASRGACALVRSAPGCRSKIGWALKLGQLNNIEV